MHCPLQTSLFYFQQQDTFLINKSLDPGIQKEMITMNLSKAASKKRGEKKKMTALMEMS